MRGTRFDGFTTSNGARYKYAGYVFAPNVLVILTYFNVK